MADQLYGAPADAGVCTGAALWAIQAQAGYDATDDSVKDRWGPIPATDHTGAPIAPGATMDPAAGVWTNAPAPVVPTTNLVGVITFKARFTPAELLGIIGSADPIVKMFLSEFIQDQRVMTVDVSSPFVQEGVGYLAGLSTPPLTPPLIDPSRIPAILAPQPL